MRRAASVATLTSLVAISCLALQAPPLAGSAPHQQASAGRSPADRKPVATVRGRVITADMMRPLRRVSVTLHGTWPQERQASATDDQGAFEFRGLAAGRYRIEAARIGYLTGQWGQRRPGEPGRPIQLAEGESIRLPDLVLTRSSAITGRVLDDFGDPVEGALVHAIRRRRGPGTARTLEAVGARTNDIGEYRIAGLRPGAYYVRAISLGPADPVVEGGAYAPTYFPGTQNPTDAQTISLPLGQDAPNVDVGLIPSRYSRLAGRVLSVVGTPQVSASVTLTHVFIDPDRLDAVMEHTGVTTTRVDGTFGFARVPPGEYRLEATVRSENGNVEFATSRIAASGSDIPDVTLLTGTGATVRGQVVFEGNRNQSFRRRGLSIHTIPGPGADHGRGAGRGGMLTSGPWFELRDVFGSRLLRVAGIPPEWALKAVYDRRNTDITDTPLDFSTGQLVTGIQIVLTDQYNDLTGTVTDAAGRPVLDYLLVVFPADPARRGSGSRFVRAERPDSSGRYRLVGLPPGEYRAAAMTDPGEWEWDDPEFLAQCDPVATPFALKEAEQLVLNLRLMDER